MVIKRECDAAMARDKKLLPCDKDCKNCMACIETTDTGERRHCTKHKNTNFAIDMKLATAGMEFEPWERRKPRCQERKKWSEMETKRLIYLREQGLTWEQIAKRMYRSAAAVANRYNSVIAGTDSTEDVEGMCKCIHVGDC